MVPERHNNVKVLLLMDVGGTMDEHIQRVEELSAAVKTEFKHLEFYYFHNCVYDFVWKNNQRRFAEKFPAWDILRKYNKDYKLDLCGRRRREPYEILQPGGSVEYNNEEPGAEWLQRLTHAFPDHAWINPRAAGRVAVPPEHRHHPAADGRPHVPPVRSRAWKRPCACCRNSTHATPFANADLGVGVVVVCRSGCPRCCRAVACCLRVSPTTARGGPR